MQEDLFDPFSMGGYEDSPADMNGPADSPSLPLEEPLTPKQKRYAALAGVSDEEVLAFTQPRMPPLLFQAVREAMERRSRDGKL